MDSKIDIAIIGECLIELAANGTLADTSTLNKYFGGDTVTTAVAIARLGGNVTYITKVGNDGFSEFIISSLKKENIDTSLIKTNFCITNGKLLLQSFLLKIFQKIV